MSAQSRVTEPPEDSSGPPPDRPVPAGRVLVRTAKAQDSAELEGWVCARPDGTIFQRPSWGRAVARTFHHQARDLVAEREGRLVGYLPLMRCRGPFGRSHLISTPYGVYGGPLGEDPETVRALALEARKLAEAEGVGRLELRCYRDPGLEELSPSDLYMTFVKDLPEDPDEVVKSMRKEERRLVRRARDKHGLELCEGPWFIQDLARLFQESKHRLGTPALPLVWFRTLLEELGPDAVIHIARRGSEALAVSMSFVDGENFRMYYIGTTAEANRLYHTTGFMIAGLQEWAIRRGLRRFDLGRSRRDAGAVKFKRNQGFESEPLHYRYGLVRSKNLPSFNPSNPRTELLRKTWARLPGWLCTRLSTRLSRMLP